MEYIDGRMEPTKFTSIGEAGMKEIVIEGCHGKRPRLLGGQDGAQLECPGCGRKSQVFELKSLGDGGFISKDFFQAVEEWNRGARDQPSSQNFGVV